MTSRRYKSLSFRLILWAAAWSIFVLIVMGVFLASVFRGAVEKSLDDRINQNLTALLASVELADDELVETETFPDPLYLIPFSGWYWQIREAGGAGDVMLASASLQGRQIGARLREYASDDDDVRTSFNTVGPYGIQLRVVAFTGSIPGSEAKARFEFMVSGNLDPFAAEARSFNRILAIALTLLALGLVLAVFLQVKFGLTPLRALTTELVSIRMGQSQRLEGDYPEEILPVARELNALLVANETVVERARTQVGNLAHALKTPLSVITNDADANSGEFAAKVSEQARTMSDQVNLYLERARRAARAHAPGAATGVHETLEGLARTLQRIHSERTIQLIIDCDPFLRFAGERQDLEEIAGNLLDNAFKWADGWVKVAVRAAAELDDRGRQQILVTVEDDGPGLPEGRFDEALKRGLRLDETKPGSGLGLSIVAEIVSIYGGDLELGISSRRGLRVSLTLPAALPQGRDE